MSSTPQGALRRFAAAALFALSTAAVAEVIVPADLRLLPAGPGGAVVGTIQGPEDSLFPGSRTGSYGFVRQPDGATTYFRVNGQDTRARRVDALGRVVGSYQALDGAARDFAIRLPARAGFVEVTVEHEEDTLG